MVPFRYDETDTIVSPSANSGYNQPKSPISAGVTKLTGITNELVAGRHRWSVANFIAVSTSSRT